MAEPDLIDRYLSELRLSLKSRDDLADLLAEVEDHLREAVDRLIRPGFDPQEAQRHTLDRFGDSAVVARAFAVTPSGGIAMPTAFTRTAGATALGAAVLWLAAAAVNWWASDLYATWTQERYVVLTVFAGLAAVGTVVVLAGMLSRAGRRDAVMAAAMVLGILAVVAMVVMTWAWAIWGLLFAAAFLLAVPRLHVATGRRRIADWALVVGWPVGFVVMVLTDTVGMGRPDYWGDYPLGMVTAFGILAVLTGIGLVSVGRGLLAEEPVESPQPIAQA